MKIVPVLTLSKAQLFDFMLGSELAKALGERWGHKYVKREIGPRGGFRYTYDRSHKDPAAMVEFHRDRAAAHKEASHVYERHARMHPGLKIMAERGVHPMINTHKQLARAHHEARRAWEAHAEYGGGDNGLLSIFHRAPHVATDRTIEHENELHWTTKDWRELGWSHDPDRKVAA